ncbi:hypothetical protein QFZ81_000093 [Paenibacillus sp. V4I9]|uniref:BglII/BstYI family type II restriction endonuclease n=1 Tax=Paenibacillus sp. V4I9 TaxID=3042308 RepID=UPI00278685FD|nr:BglII/BstYI family type II restriction endonuclease [Paenibacillus sp. V4I9]MDQ0885005.1 hypothetical protein [Paenibacillus sp. V4I9]
MKIGAQYSHLNGFEYLKYHKSDILDEIYEVISSIDAEKYKTKVSEEKTKMGQVLYSPGEMNKAFKDKLEARDWKEERYKYYVTDDENLTRKVLSLSHEEQKAQIEAAGKVALESYNQTDFVKKRTAVELQFGKYAFVAFDVFVKHMGFYIADKIDVGIEILPTKKLLNEMSSGPSYYERELQHIIRQGRGNPPVPLLLIGIEP